MKDENIRCFWGSWKNLSFRGGFHEKPIYTGDYLKMGVWTVCRVKGGGLGKKELGVDTPTHTMIYIFYFCFCLFLSKTFLFQVRF